VKFFRPVVALLSIAVALMPASAFAQVSTGTTTTTTGGGPGTTLPMCSGGHLSIPKINSSSGRPQSQNPQEISQADCLNNGHLEFDYGYNGPGSNQLQVWGLRTDHVDVTDCISAANRLDSDCQQVAEMIVGAGGKLYVGDRVLAEKLLAGMSCTDTSEGDGTISVDLFIMAVVPGTDATDYCTYTAALDLVGPSPPNDVTAGTSDSSLILNFTALTDPDFIGYNVYCDDGSGVPSGTGGAGGSSAASTGSAAAREGWHPGPQFLTTGVGLGVGGAGGAGGAVPAVAVVGAGPTLPSCTYSKVLRAGQIPDGRFFVTQSGSSQITATTADGAPMKNGTEYACAVAAIDTVGNVGPLSNVACGIPHPTDDFFGEYLGDSGQAGGGFCTIGRRSSAFAALSALVGLSLLVLAGRRRSRARRRRGP
jgi:hypothetical protein